jgi:hypothetical protein
MRNTFFPVWLTACNLINCWARASDGVFNSGAWGGVEINYTFTMSRWLCRYYTGIFLSSVRISQHPYTLRTCFSAYCACRKNTSEFPVCGRLDSDCAGFCARIVTAPRKYGTLSFYSHVCKSCACYRYRPPSLVCGVQHRWMQGERLALRQRVRDGM